MPAVAEKIYANLIKDPDLDIPEGLTREEVARTEADQRERQYINNSMALSLVKEEIKANYGSSKKQPFYKALPEVSMLYDNLSPEAQNHIDLLFKASLDEGTYGEKLDVFIHNIFNQLSN